MAPIKLSVITNNVHAKLCECTTLDELSTLITSQDWAPSTFKESYRKKENFEATSLMALDVDEGCTLEEAKQIFSGYQHLIATTRSHGAKRCGQRSRVSGAPAILHDLLASTKSGKPDYMRKGGVAQ